MEQAFACVWCANCADVSADSRIRGAGWLTVQDITPIPGPASDDPIWQERRQGAPVHCHQECEEQTAAAGRLSARFRPDPRSRAGCRDLVGCRTPGLAVDPDRSSEQAHISVILVRFSCKHRSCPTPSRLLLHCGNTLFFRDIACPTLRLPPTVNPPIARRRGLAGNAMRTAIWQK